VSQPEETDLRAFERWPWISSLSQNVYGVSEGPDALPTSWFRATDSVDDVPPGRTLRRGLHLPCDGLPFEIPSGADGTIVRVSEPDPAARFWASDELAPLPARRAILVSPELATDGKLAVRCTGPAYLVVDVSEAVRPATD
jgi:hypothetical protein